MNTLSRPLAALLVTAPVVCGAWTVQPHDPPKEPASKVEPVTGPGGFIYENKAENLKELFGRMLAARNAGDEKTLAAFLRGLFPTPERTRRAVREDLAKDRVEAIGKWIEKVVPKGDDATVAKVFRPSKEQTEVRVTAYKVADLAKRNDPALPGGYGRMAAEVLRPEAVIYRVRLIKPGEDSGWNGDMLWWDEAGRTWCMLGALWRADREAAPQPPAPAPQPAPPPVAPPKG